MIRFATERDVEKLAEIHVNNIRRTYRNIYTQEYFLSLNENIYKEHWQKYLAREDCRTLVYENDCEILGFCGICLYNALRKMPVIDYLHVSEKAERQGVAKQLLDVSMAILVNEEAIKMLEIDYIEGNDYARKYYEKSGAQYVGSYIGTGGGRTLFHNRMIFDNLNCRRTEHINLKLGLNEEYEKLKMYLRGDYVLWGVGEYYNVFCEKIAGIKRPIYIFDNNKEYQGLTVNKVKIIAPEKTNKPIIITCARSKQIINILKNGDAQNMWRFIHGMIINRWELIYIKNINA